MPVEHLALGTEEYGFRKRGGACAEVKGSIAHVWFLALLIAWYWGWAEKLAGKPAPTPTVWCPAIRIEGKHRGDMPGDSHRGQTPW
jgi:hypothetical protein